MKDILVLLVVLFVQNTKVCSVPYKPDSDGICRNTATEYHADGPNLCCKRCPPGHRLKEECTHGTDSICEQCGPDSYLENWNYASNCLMCTKCSKRKGLEYAQQCNSTSNSKCVCQPGKFCQMGFNKPYCKDCRAYTKCKEGYGVALLGTQTSDVRCEPCPDGTFSTSVTYTDRCMPHTICNGRSVIRFGDAISDTKCEEQTTVIKHPTETVVTTASTLKTTIGANSESTVPSGTSGSIQSVRTSVSETVPVTTAAPDTELTPVIVGVVGVVTGFLLIVLMVLLLLYYKKKWRKGSLRILPKIDANGNHESADKIGQNHMKTSGVTSFTVTSPEQVCLLKNGETSSNTSQSSAIYENLARTDEYSNHESISPLQPTLAVDNPTSALSEPMTLRSHTEPTTPPPSIPTQSSSQPTSPQIISPVTNSPHVNVNITLHIGNGSCGAPSFIPTDSMEAECNLPFGEEEESVSIPQQEAGKQMLMSL